MAKIVSIVAPTGTMASYGYVDAPKVVGEQTIYQTTGVVDNPVPPIEPPIPPVVPPNVVMGKIAVQYKGQPTTITTAQIACFPLPVAPSGYIQLVQAVNTPVNTQVEIWFSTTPGNVTDPLREQVGKNQWGGTGKPCSKNYSYTGGPIKWSTTGGDANVGYLPPTPGVTYYVNFRYVGTTPPNVPTTMLVQWN